MSRYSLYDLDTHKPRYTSQDIHLSNISPELRKGLLAKEMLHKDISLKNIDLINASFRGTNLRHVSFEGANLYGASFKDTTLEGVSFKNAVLSMASFEDCVNYNCDFSGAIMSGTDLKNASFNNPIMQGITANNVPIISDIHSKMYKATLPKDSINVDSYHTSDSIHDMAGWVVHLAGSDGKVLEEKCGTINAAMLIYAVSDPTLFSPTSHIDFFASKAATRMCINQFYKERNVGTTFTKYDVVTFKYYWNNLELSVEAQIDVEDKTGTISSCTIAGREVDLTTALVVHNLYLEDALINRANGLLKGDSGE